MVFTVYYFVSHQFLCGLFSCFYGTVVPSVLLKPVCVCFPRTQEIFHICGCHNYIHVHVHAHKHTRTRARTHTHTHTHTHIRTHTHRHSYEIFQATVTMYSSFPRESRLFSSSASQRIRSFFWVSRSGSRMRPSMSHRRQKKGTYTCTCTCASCYM